MSVLTGWIDMPAKDCWAGLGWPEVRLVVGLLTGHSSLRKHHDFMG